MYLYLEINSRSKHIFKMCLIFRNIKFLEKYLQLNSFLSEVKEMHQLSGGVSTTRPRGFSQSNFFKKWMLHSLRECDSMYRIVF